MRILNLGCGAVRPPPPFTNLDSLCQILPFGTPERENLNRESNYVEADLRNPLPFPDDTFDGILASHILEHFDAITGTAILRECRRVLMPDGQLMVSVPDAAYHRRVYSRDNKQNAVELFGEGIPETEPKQTFLEYALFFLDHRAVYTADSLWSILVNAGFSDKTIYAVYTKGPPEIPGVFKLMHDQLNRRMFSLVMLAQK